MVNTFYYLDHRCHLIIDQVELEVEDIQRPQSEALEVFFFSYRVSNNISYVTV